MIVAFKDSKDGFYQTEIPEGGPLPEWAADFTQLTEEQRLAELAKTQEIPVQQ